MESLFYFLNNYLITYQQYANDNSVAWAFFLMASIIALTFLMVTCYSIFSILLAIRALIYSLAYRLSPEMQKTDAEIEKIRASKPSFLFRLDKGGKKHVKDIEDV